MFKKYGVMHTRKAILSQQKTNHMKKLVIIHGVTGAIGSACLAHFASQKDTVVYGISRKARDFRDFCSNGKLPIATLICSLSGRSRDDHYPARMMDYFGKAIEADAFDKIYYIHALGVYPFEIDEQGNRIVRYDNDQDGIDDRCRLLTLDMFDEFYIGLPNRVQKSVHSFIFGGIADKHEPLAHVSWWKTMKLLKQGIIENFSGNMESSIKERIRVSLVNISSVLCPNELITRPFVFSKTDGDPQYWLKPEEVAMFVSSIMDIGQGDYFKEYELFKKRPDFDADYYKDEKFTPRKVAELFLPKQ
jgi:hypothetical protein